MKKYLLLVVGAMVLSSCSSHYKKRQEMREKASAASGLYCEFISGDLYTDLDVELNLQMAKKCEVDKNYSITNYKNASDQIGVIYCCQIQKKVAKASSVKSSASSKENSSATPAAPSPSAGSSGAASPAGSATPPASADPDALDE